MKTDTATEHPPVRLHEHEVIHGCRVEDVTRLPDMRAVAYRLLHDRSGARILHLHTEDRENLFAAAFRTPPTDDTGLPHIVEHTVLCGSRRYPVKDPFVALLKTSLATFLNAMTYPDRTVYPCASVVEKDFFHLAGVYCDAVFHPLLTEAHFKQEGYHYDFETPGVTASPLVIKGIVFNEMKGAYSDLDGIIGRRTAKSVCPDNAYGKDSGGDPEAIPALTYPRFLEFHRTYYHPSNAFIFLYGNIPTERHLAFLDSEYLSGFRRAEIDTAIKPQPRWRKPMYRSVPYPIAAHEEPSRKAAVALTFLTNDVTEAIRSLSMNVLEYYLIGNAASPLRKALIDSKLGEELTPSGYGDHQRDTFFTVGLKGTDPEAEEEIEGLIRTTCARLVEEGLERGKVEAAFHRLELSASEISGQYPLQCMDRVYRSWIYDGDPLQNLRMNRQLEELRWRSAETEGFFEGQLRELIVENPHYSRLTFVPDPGFATRSRRAFRHAMERRKADMSAEDLERIAREAAELEATQNAPAAAEALATLPRLALTDIPAEPQEIDTEVMEVADVPLLRTRIYANGLATLRLAFDLRDLDQDLVDFVPLYGEVLRKMGAGAYDFAAMAEREAACTGGVSVGLSIAGRVDDPAREQPQLLVQSKALDRNVRDMLGILSDRILAPDLTDMDRLKDVILQGRVRRKSAVIPGGNRHAVLRAARNLSQNAATAERVGGISQVRLYDRLVRGFDENRDEIVGRLARIRSFLLQRARLAASFVGSDPAFDAVKTFLSEIGGTMGCSAPASFPPRPRAPQPSLREGIATPADVAFVATALPAVGAAHPHAPALALLGVQLSLGYLWEQVRMKGGAYGARAHYSPFTGIFSVSSYRDPHIRETLEVFAHVPAHVAAEMALAREEMEQAVIGTIKGLDRPVRPAQAAEVALSRYITGETAEFRRSFREKILGLTAEAVRRAAAEILAPGLECASVCVIAAREKLDEANLALGQAALDVADL